MVGEAHPDLGRKGRVLLVEDTQFFQELIGSYLKSDGYEVATAVNGKEALRLLETEAFDLVVSRYRNARHGRLGFCASRACKILLGTTCRCWR